MYHQVIETLKDTPQYRARRRIVSGNSGEEYVVSIRKRDNRWACACKGWIFTYQKKNEDCKHIKEVKETYGDKGRSDAILAQFTQFTKDLNGIDVISALARWKAIKDPISMLLFYFENTPEESVRAENLSQALDAVKIRLDILVSQ